MLSTANHVVSIAVLASGSRGNCTYVGDGRTGVLVDCGISTAQIFARMKTVGLTGAPLDAVLVTHEHRDHVGSAAVLARKILRIRSDARVPFFMTAGTARSLPEHLVPNGLEFIRPGDSIRVGGIDISAFSIPHDTADPVAYRLELAGVRIAIVTDLGKVTSLVRANLEYLDVAILEFNHDLEMLLEGSYPWHLKQRIRGIHGHLSNEQAADLLGSIFHRNLGHLFLAHLSEENNRPAKALKAARQALRSIEGGDDLPITVASQYKPSPLVRLAPKYERSSE